MISSTRPGDSTGLLKQRFGGLGEKMPKKIHLEYLKNAMRWEFSYYNKLPLLASEKNP